VNEEKQLSERLIEFLENHSGEVFSKAELVQILDAADRVLRDKLKRLIKHDEILFEKISVRVARKIYKDNNLKRGMRLYFLE